MDEEKGFIIRDRRGVGSESVEKTNDTAAQAQTAKPAEPAQKQPVPPINFLSFVYSLGTSALMCLGEPVGEGAAGQTPNLAQAQEIIDILTMLESKTKGDRKSTRLNSSHGYISYAVFCLKKKKKTYDKY